MKRGVWVHGCRLPSIVLPFHPAAKFISLNSFSGAPNTIFNPYLNDLKVLPVPEFDHGSKEQHP